MRAVGPASSCLLGLFVASLLLSPSPARADFYQCRVDGRSWITNHIPRGQRRHCRLIMKTAPKREEKAEKRTSADERAKRKARRARQREAVRPHTPRQTTHPDLPDDRLMRLVREAAARYTLPPAFILAVMKIESNFHPRAVSRVGAQGLMQLMPATAESLGVTDSFDPRQNIMGGSKYLRMLATRFDGDMARTLAGYHAGGGAVRKKEGVPYAATEQYVRMVLDRYYQYKKLLAAENH